MFEGIESISLPVGINAQNGEHYSAMKRVPEKGWGTFKINGVKGVNGHVVYTTENQQGEVDIFLPFAGDEKAVQRACARASRVMYCTGINGDITVSRLPEAVGKSIDINIEHVYRCSCASKAGYAHTPKEVGETCRKCGKGIYLNAQENGMERAGTKAGNGAQQQQPAQQQQGDGWNASQQQQGQPAQQQQQQGQGGWPAANEAQQQQTQGSGDVPF